MNELKIFENTEFGTIRTLNKDGSILFVGIDVAEKLNYQNGSRDIARHVDIEDVCSEQIYDGKQSRSFLLINESGLYSLILNSKMPKAKQFKHWVTSDILPSIRQNGGYIKDQEVLTPEQIMANALVVAQSVIDKKNAVIKEMKPKADYFDAVTGSRDAIEIANVAKVLNHKGIGRNALFEILRDMNILQKDNIPYQKYIDRGYFRVMQQSYTTQDGETHVTFKTLVFQKGVENIMRLLNSTEVEKWLKQKKDPTTDSGRLVRS